MITRLSACLFSLTLIGGSVSAADVRPNVVLILADDLGWTDLACFGSDLHETPALDRLARDGMKFTQKGGLTYKNAACAAMVESMDARGWPRACQT